MIIRMMGFPKPGLHPVPPMDNTERQRRFRERNPGYYGRLHARRRAGVREFLAAKAHAEAMAAVTLKPVLMLPAPVEVIAIHGLNAVPVSRQAIHVNEPLALSRD